MNSHPAGSAVSRKEIKALRRSGFSNGAVHQSTGLNGFPPNRSKSAQRRRYRKKSVGAMSLNMSSKNDPSSSDSEDDDDADDDDDGDGDDGQAYDYVSLFHVYMNYLFPRAFPIQPVHRWIKSAQSVSDLRERSTGKILSPVGRCTIFPQGVFVQSTSEKDVTKICFPKAQETFKAPSRSSRYQ